MRKVRIGTKDYDDPLAGLSDAALREAAERMEPMRRDRTPSGESVYAPKKPIAIEVRQPGGESRRFIVKPVDLTPHGFGGLIGLYLYPNLECTVHLVTHDGEHMTVSGRTEQCVFLCNKAHYMGIRFDSRIDIELFFPTAARAQASGDAAEGVSPIARLIERIDGRPDHPLRDDFVTILRAETARLTGEPAMLTPHELMTPIRVAVVSYQGNILAVNPSWLLFAAESGYAGESFSKLNYLETLRARLESCASVRPVHDAFVATTLNKSAECRYAYACQGGRGEINHYLVRHTAEVRLKQRVVVVSHILIDSDAIEAIGEAA